MSQKNSLLNKLNFIIRKASKKMDKAETLRGMIVKNMPVEVDDFFGRVQDKLDEYIYLEKERVDSYADGYSGTAYLFSYYNSEWFEESLFSEQALMDFAAYIIEATRQYDDNPFLRKLASGEYRLHSDTDNTEELLTYELANRRVDNVNEKINSNANDQ